MAMLRWTWLVCATLVVAEEGKWPTCLEGGVAYTNLLDISDAYAENRLVQEPNGGYLANAKACQESCKVAPSCKKFTFKTGSNPPGACFLIDARDDLTHRYTEHDAVSGSVSCNFSVVIPSMTAPAAAAAEEAAAKTGEAAAGAASTGIAAADTATSAVGTAASKTGEAVTGVASTGIAAADTATSAVGTAASKTGEAVTGVASTGIAAVDTATSAAETAAAKTGGVAAGVASASREVPIATPITPIILPAPAKSKPADVVDDSEAQGPAKSLAQGPANSLAQGPANSLAQSPANSLAQGPAKSYIAQSPTGMNSNTLWAVLGGVAVAAALGGVAAFASSSSESKKGGKRGLKISAQDEESATSIAPSPLYAPPSARPQPGPGPMAAPTPGFQPVMYFQQPQLHQVQPVPQVFYTQVPQ